MMAAILNYRDILALNPMPGLSCVGTTLKLQRCQNRISMLDCDEAQRILINLQARDVNANVSLGIWNALYGDLYQLAMVTLCRRWHRFDRVGAISQVRAVSPKWYTIIRDLSGQRVVQNPGIYYGHSLQPALPAIVQQPLVSVPVNAYASAAASLSSPLHQHIIPSLHQDYFTPLSSFVQLPLLPVYLISSASTPLSPLSTSVPTPQDTLSVENRSTISFLNTPLLTPLSTPFTSPITRPITSPSSSAVSSSPLEPPAWLFPSPDMSVWSMDPPSLSILSLDSEASSRLVTPSPSPDTNHTASAQTALLPQMSLRPNLINSLATTLATVLATSLAEALSAALDSSPHTSQISSATPAMLHNATLPNLAFFISSTGNLDPVTTVPSQALPRPSTPPRVSPSSSSHNATREPLPEICSLCDLQITQLWDAVWCRGACGHNFHMDYFRTLCEDTSEYHHDLAIKCTHWYRTHIS